MNNSLVCIDASLVVRMISSCTYGLPAWELWRTWHETDIRPAAPTLLFYEVSNALRRYVVHGTLLPEDADEGLEAALALGIQLFGDPDLHRRALRLASVLELPAAYDAHYLALAERLNAEFWTADRRLFLAASETLSSIRLLEDSP